MMMGIVIMMDNYFKKSSLSHFRMFAETGALKKQIKCRIMYNIPNFAGLEVATPSRLCFDWKFICKKSKEAMQYPWKL
jgi:hypothetical protein